MTSHRDPKKLKLKPLYPFTVSYDYPRKLFSCLSLFDSVEGMFAGILCQ